MTAAAPGVAVVGTGFGLRVHVPALRAAGFDVKVLVGGDAERTRRRADRAGVARAATSLGEALDGNGVDAVTIATPPDTHGPLALEAVAAGRHVICEKPFAMTAAEAAAMRDAAAAAGVVALVGHEFRWAAERAVAARALHEGRIGEPRFAALSAWSPLAAAADVRVPPWWFDAGRGGGWLGASGSHVVDQVRVWFGEVATVSASLPVVADRPGAAEDSFVVHFRTRSGVAGVLLQTAAAWGPAEATTRVAGTAGSLWLEGGEAWLATAAGAAPLPVPEELVPPAPPAASDDPRHRFTHLELGPYTRLAEAFRAAMEGRAPPPGPAPATFADGWACMRVLDAIRESAATGRTVELPDGGGLSI